MRIEKEKAPVVVIRANDNCFLDVIRGLGRNNIPFISVVYTWAGVSEWISERSCFFKDPVTICNPAENPNLALDGLIALGKKLLSQYGKKCMLIPTSDTIQMFMQLYFETLSQYFVQMGPNGFENPCLNLINKAKFAHLLSNNGIATPISFSVENTNDIQYAIDNVPYPCMYKPAVKDLTNSFQAQHHGEKAIECANKDELRIALNDELKKGHKLIVQRKIITRSLDEAHSIYVYRDGAGNVRAIGGICGLYRYPEHVGTATVLCPTIDETMYALAENITKLIEWRGFLGYELKWDSINNTWTVIEANLRPWLTINYQATLGIEFLDLLYRDFCGTLPTYTRTLNIKNDNVKYVGLSASINMFISQTGNEQSGLDAMLKYIVDNKGKLVFSYNVTYDTAPGEYEYELICKKYYNHINIVTQINREIIDNNKRLFL